MKARTTLLIFASLLLIASLAVAETPAAPASAMVPLADTACGSTTSLTAATQGVPLPTQLALIHCGCGNTQCIGSGIGASCQLGGTVGRCENISGNLCASGPVAWSCQCWSGPLP